MRKLAFVILGFLAFASAAHADGMMALMDDEALAQIEGRWGMTISYSALDAQATNYAIFDHGGAGGVAIPGVEGLPAAVQTLGGWLDFWSMRFAGRITGAYNNPIYSGNAHGTWTHAAGGMQVSNLTVNMGRVNDIAGMSFLAIGIPTMIGAAAVQHVRLSATRSATEIWNGFGQFGFFIQDLEPYANTALYIFAQP